MPTDKTQTDRAKKVQRTIPLDESLSALIAMAQEKRNTLVTAGQNQVNQGESALKYAVEVVFRKAETPIPKTNVQITKNQETGMPVSLTWEEIVKDGSCEDGDGEDGEGAGADEPDGKADPSAASTNGKQAHRKLPVK